MNTKLIVMSLLMLSISLAQGATDPTDFIQLQASDGSGQSSFAAGTNWPEGAAPSAGNSYCVPSGLTLKTAGNVNETFAGDVLAVSGTFEVNKGREYRMACSDLRLLNGASMNCSGIQNIDGKLTAEGTSQINYMWPDGYNWIYWNADLASEADAELKIGRTTQYYGYPKVAMPDAALKMNGDWSQFFGTLHLLKNSSVAVCTAEPIPGTVTLESGAYWTFNWPRDYSTKTSVGGLNLGDGATVDFYFYNSTCGGFTVTNAFTHGAATIRIRNNVNNYATGVILPKGYLEYNFPNA